ncbi:MAG: hypothetical protein ICCCNLDF_03439 [Planctomycetes bacterium]|nr:hypothetical protein [Planctomycetota bacterium]
MALFSTRECPFCHRIVSRWLYLFHSLSHTRRLPDGQQADHATLRPSARYHGPLDDVPQVYYHAKCGGCTVMPEDIIRSYLVNPTLYNDETFCAGCGRYVRQRELEWTETGENLQQYFARLKLKRRG